MQRLYDLRKAKKPRLTANGPKSTPPVIRPMRRTVRRSRGCRTCRGRKYAHNSSSNAIGSLADPALESNATRKSQRARGAVEVSYNAKATMNPSS